MSNSLHFRSSQQQPVLYLKNENEVKFNQHGVERCVVSQCKKTKFCANVNGYNLCPFHAKQIASDGIRLVQPKPVEYCHAVGCQTYQHLRRAFRGKFCPIHLEQLTAIRRQLEEAKKYLDFRMETYWRQQEAQFRKFQEEVHGIWLNRLEQVYGKTIVNIPSEHYPEYPEDYSQEFPEDYLEEGYPQEFPENYSEDIILEDMTLDEDEYFEHPMEYPMGYLEQPLEYLEQPMEYPIGYLDLTLGQMINP
jgi:hypothetical protein